MNGIRTDVIALAAILGSAAVGGATSMAWTGDSSDEFYQECATTVVETAPRVVISLGGEGDAVVVAPQVSVGTDESCGVQFGEVRIDRVPAQMDRARARVERARERVERVNLVRFHDLEGQLSKRHEDLEGLSLQLEGLEGGWLLELQGLEELAALEALREMDFDGLSEELEAEIEGRVESKMRELEERLERVGRGNGR
jgi:hypothetical protein